VRPAQDEPEHEPMMPMKRPGVEPLPSDAADFSGRHLLIVGTHQSRAEAQAQVDDILSSSEGFQRDVVLDTNHFSNLKNGLFIVVEAVGTEEAMRQACDRMGSRECYMKNAGEWVP